MQSSRLLCTLLALTSLGVSIKLHEGASESLQGSLAAFDTDITDEAPHKLKGEASLLEQSQVRYFRKRGNSNRYEVTGGTDEVVELTDMPAIHEASDTRDWMEFWQGQSSEQKRTDALASETASGKATKYLTFDTDAGGFNNMRMAFEYFVDLAHRSGRTLVLPQTEGWYLIDWGPLNSNNKKDPMWISGKPESTYGEFFDIDYIKQKGLPVLTAAEFFEREGSRLGIPHDADPTKHLQNSPDPNPWKEWLDAAPGPRACKDGSTMAFAEEPILHYGKGNARFLDCLWSGLSTPSGSDAGRKLIHYNPKLFEMASRPVAELGAGHYMALHLRRNDFQYQQAPSAADAGKLAKNLEAKLKPGEAVYVASDEIDQNWWKSLRAAFHDNGHKMITLVDFEDGLKAQGMSRRNAGLVEQLICSAARNFIGTPQSTYSAGIMLLRQEIGEGHKANSSGSTGEKTEYHVGRQFLEP